MLAASTVVTSIPAAPPANLKLISPEGLDSSGYSSWRRLLRWKLRETVSVHLKLIVNAPGRTSLSLRLGSPISMHSSGRIPFLPFPPFAHRRSFVVTVCGDRSCTGFEGYEPSVTLVHFAASVMAPIMSIYAKCQFPACAR